MASSLTTSGFRPPFWPYRVGTSTTPVNAISGGLFTNTNTFFDGDIPSFDEIFGGPLFQDTDTFFDGFLSNRGEISGSLLGDNIGVLGVSTSNDEGMSASHTVDIPNGGNVVGRLVLVAISADEDPTFSFPSGWTELLDVCTSNVSLGVGYRVIDGTEGFSGSSDTITVTTSTRQTTSHIAYIIENFISSEIEINTQVTGTSNIPDPGSITPSGGYNNYLNIALVAHDVGVTTTTGFPTLQSTLPP